MKIKKLKKIWGEEWKPIEGFDNAYAVSNYGRVCSFINPGSHKIDGKRRIKKHTDNGHGYHNITIDYKGEQKTFYVHRLVGFAFIKNPQDFPIINHKDENKSNNCAANLEWCSYSYNNNYGTCRARAWKTWEDMGYFQGIDVYSLTGDFIKHYECANHVKLDGFSRRGVYNVCNGRTKSYKGLVFRFTGDAFSYDISDTKTRYKPKKIIKATKDGDIVKIYPSIKSAERANGFSRNFLYSSTYGFSRKAFVGGFYYYTQTDDSD